MMVNHANDRGLTIETVNMDILQALFLTLNKSVLVLFRLIAFYNRISTFIILFFIFKAILREAKERYYFNQSRYWVKEVQIFSHGIILNLTAWFDYFDVVDKHFTPYANETSPSKNFTSYQLYNLAKVANFFILIFWSNLHVLFQKSVIKKILSKYITEFWNYLKSYLI